MKKFLFMLVMMCCTLVAMADDTKTCPVTGTTGEVRITTNTTHNKSNDKDESIVTVTFTNDTKEYASVYYDLEIKTKGSISHKTGSYLVKPESSESFDLTFPLSIVLDVKVAKFTGTKCSN